MKRLSWFATIAMGALAPLLVLTTVGCGPTEVADGDGDKPHVETGDPAGDGSPQTVQAGDPQTDSPAPSNEQPGGVVQRFLDALRNGDEKVASALLTTKAREETSKRNLAVQPPGTPSAAYKVGRTELLEPNQDGAYVSSMWTETDQTGVSDTFEIVWVMRKESSGWRIAGMATEVVEGGEPLFLNFEDPEDMLRKWREADEELARRESADAPQTEVAADPDAAAPPN